MRRHDSMACAVPYAIWDHAEQLAMVAQPGPTLIMIYFNWAKADSEMPYTHVDPWEGLLVRVSGV